MKDEFIYIANALLLLLTSKIGVVPVAYGKKARIIFFVSFFISVFYFLAVKDFRFSVFMLFLSSGFSISATFHWLAFKRWS